MATAIGIDLGTYFSEVAYLDNGRPRPIPNAEGQRCTRSVVAFTPSGEPVVGQTAKAQAAINPSRTVFSIKRRMGSRYRVDIGGRKHTPQEISSFILRQLKADAETYLGERIDRAVITVPAYFNDHQRQATREAGALAGLDVLGLVSEPTAAALAYGLNREDAHTVLVWDLGAGTFDVSILDLGEGVFEVRAVSGDTRLGGDDFTQRVVDYLAQQYGTLRGANLPDQPEVWQRLRDEAEKAKIRLCYSSVVRVAYPLSGNGVEAPEHLETPLTREQFEAITRDLVERLIAPTRQALKDAHLFPQDIDRVILAGGGCLMPRVRELALSLLGKQPYRYIDPFTVVAQGAAIYAGMLQGQVEKVVLLDVLPLSLGVETQGGLTARLIPRNTPLPTSEARVFATATDYQTSMDIHVLQGERELAGDNISLGQFQLTGIPPAPRGVAKVEVAFEADVDGIVHVSARDLSTDTTVDVKLTSSKLLDAGEIECLQEEARRCQEQDRETRQRILTGIEASNTVAAAEAALKDLGGELSGPLVTQLGSAITGVKEALSLGNMPEAAEGCQKLRQLLEASAQESKNACGQAVPT